MSDNKPKTVAWRHTFPKSIRQAWKDKHGEDGPESITMKEATIADDLNAMRIARASENASLALEMTKQCITEIDGKPATRQAVEDFYARATHKQIELINALWAHRNSASGEEVEDFFAASEIVVS